MPGKGVKQGSDRQVEITSAQRVDQTVGQEEIAESPFRSSDPRFAGEYLDRNLTQVDAIAEVAQSLDLTAGQLALAWLLAQGDDIVPIPGSRRSARVLENAAAASVHLTPAQLTQLDAAAPPAGWVGDRQSFAIPNRARVYQPAQ